VTTFTASDFARSFTTNGDGTDHAWGGHHSIMGGAVNGGDIYGQYPTLGVDVAGFNNPDNVGGAQIPTTSVDQYGATLGAGSGCRTPTSRRSSRASRTSRRDTWASSRASAAPEAARAAPATGRAPGPGGLGGGSSGVDVLERHAGHVAAPPLQDRFVGHAGLEMQQHEPRRGHVDLRAVRSSRRWR
jgi:hypothetical protein